MSRTNGRISNRLAHDERGATSVQMVVIMPLMFLIAFTGLQAGLYFYGRSAALSAATTGARAAAVEYGSTAHCQRAAAEFVDSLGDVLTEPRIDCARTATTVTVRGQRRHLECRTRLDSGGRAGGGPAGREADAMTRLDERGSASIEAVVVGPAVVLLILLVVFGGRIALAHQTVQTIAADSARAASLARNHVDARQAAAAAMNAGFDQELPCASLTLELNLDGFDKKVGAPASVSATVTCRLVSADLGLPGLPELRITSTMSSPVDTYRERR